MNNREYLTNKSFCPLPWTGIHINTDGEVKNCIVSNEILGDLTRSDLPSIVTGEVNTTIKQQMLQDQKPNNCNACYLLEQQKNSFDIVSSRIYYLKELKNLPLNHYVDANTFDLYHTDVRWNNTCNHACVYCEPKYSSRWAEELKETIVKPDISQTKQYVFDRVEQLTNVYLAGGEPLLMKENEEFLKLLLTTNPEVNIRVNTNLSKTQTKVFDLICQFKNVHWTVSVESQAQEFEYIRYGGNWNDFSENLSEISRLGHKISFNMLWFVLNYKSIFTTIDYFKQLGFHNNSYVLSPVNWPNELDVRNLPDAVLDELAQELEERIGQHPGYLLENGYIIMLNHLKSGFIKDAENTKRYIQDIDQRRGLDSHQIFKEFYHVL